METWWGGDRLASAGLEADVSQGGCSQGPLHSPPHTQGAAGGASPQQLAEVSKEHQASKRPRKLVLLQLPDIPALGTEVCGYLRQSAVKSGQERGQPMKRGREEVANSQGSSCQARQLPTVGGQWM